MVGVTVDYQDQLGPGNIAAPWWRGGCSVVPIRADGTKSPLVAWKQYQQIPPSSNTVHEWFEQQWPRAGVAVICGRVSGNLEMLELEGRANKEEILAGIEQSCIDHGVGDIWRMLTTTGYTEMTPSGGLHILYRVFDAPVPGNEKIATRPATEDELTDQERQLRERNPTAHFIRVLAETRGDGGYVIVAPTGGNCHPTGYDWITLTGTQGEFISISWEQRCLLHLAFRSVLHVPSPTQEIVLVEPRPVVIERDPDAPLTPVEDFNAKASWNDGWFTEQGWRVHHQDGNEIFWTRPGKDWGDGHSASTGVRDGGQDCLYVWSTSTGLPTEVPLTKFMVYAHYQYNGDRSRAARVLQQLGYGEPLHPPLVELRDEDLLPRERGEDEPLPDHALERLLADASDGIILTDLGYARRTWDAYRNHIRFNATTKSWCVWHSGSGTWGEDNYAFANGAVTRIVESNFNWMRGFERQNIRADGEPRFSPRQVEKLVSRAQDYNNNGRIKAVLERLAAIDGVRVTAESFDKKLDLLNLRNGTLDLANFELKSHDSADMITMCFNAEFDPYAECPNFQKYLEEVIPDPDIRTYIQRAVGYSLLGRPQERAIFLLYGPSGTGKSVFTDVMTELFGEYGGTAPPSTFKLKKQDSYYDLHRLRGKRFVSASEMPQKMEMDEELVKRLTGGDRINSRDLYQSFVEWEPRCVIWLATNHLPKITSDDDAMWRRVRTVPMKTVIKARKEEVKGFSDVLVQEANGLLNWALDGLREYRRIGLAEPDVILADIEAYHQDSDTVSSWLNSMVEGGDLRLVPEQRMSVAELYALYDEHCVSNGDSRYGKQRFAKRLESVSAEVEVRKVGGNRWIYGIGKGI